MKALIVLALLIAGTASAADPRVKEAERLAAHGEVDAARAQFQTLHDELRASGAETSAALHYNLGTLALTVDDLGDAVLHLTAAAKRAPLDDDIRHNLDVALGRRADQVSASRPLAAGARLPPGPIRLLLGVALALLGVVVAVGGLTTGRVGRMVRRALAPIAALVVIAAGLVALRGRADAVDVAVVMGDTEARPQPDPTAVGFSVHAGLTGAVVAEQQGFLRLRLENGIDVWVARDAVKLVP